MTGEERILYIGIAGKKRSGKDTFATDIQDELRERGIVAVKRGFADGIREELAPILCRELAGADDWPADPRQRMFQIVDAMDSEIDSDKEPFRLIMQWWGLDFRRRWFGENYWIRQMESFANRQWEVNCGDDETLVVLIPDVRMPNEIEFFRQRNGLIVKVHRPCLESTDIHPTETALDDYIGWDWIIVNDTIPEMLQRWALDFARTCLFPRLRIE